MKTLIAAAALGFVVTLPAQDINRVRPADREEAARLFKIYREDPDMGTREMAVEKLLTMHETVVKALTPALEKDWQTAVTNYRAALARLAAQFAQKKVADPAFAKEVRMHREKLTKLRAAMPRKEQLANEGMVAFGRLRALHTVYAPDLVALQPSFHDMTQLARALTRMRAALKVKVTKLQNNADFSEEDLKREENDTVARAFWINSSAGGAFKTNAALAAQKVVPADEAEAVRALNEMRALLGLAPCLIDPALHKAAREHSKDMATANFFAHESPTPGRKTLADRAKLAGTTASAESIAMGMTEPAEVIQYWFVSPEDHLKIFGERRRVGIGRHEMHWTLLLGD